MPDSLLDIPTRPDSLENARYARSIAELLESIGSGQRSPVVSLDEAIAQLGYIDRRTLGLLMQEDPALLRNKSSDLVRRLLLTTEELHHALARTAGTAEVDAAHFELGKDVAAVLPYRALRAYDVLVLGQANDSLFVAAWRPTSEDLHASLCALTGRSVSLVWADRDDIVARLDRLDPFAPMSAPERADRQTSLEMAPTQRANSVGAGVSPETQNIEYLTAEAVHELAAGADSLESAETNEASAMVRMVKRLIMDAQARHASDIHIETNPGDEFTRIRLRRDGDLEVYTRLPAKLRAPMVSRIKVMAKLDISEHRRPQDGKINFADFGGDHLELRVAVMPTHDGMEDVVLRLLASSRVIPLAQLGLQPRDAETFARMSAHSFGLILAVGPTGSGKTTTLHSMLAEINTEEKKIWTAEDPIEITQAGLRQVQVNPKIGLTFASAMRGFLRSDPDVIMIGEIRDEETAGIAVEASLTGHLVMSTLHTNNASESVVRLLELGMDPMNFADSLVGIVAQRLVRASCPHCAQAQYLSAAQFTKLVAEYVDGSPLSTELGTQRLLTAARVTTPDQVQVKASSGCTHCAGKGYKGRIGIYEILENSPRIRLLIQRNARPTEIFQEAVSAGMRSLRHDALEKWVQGLIDLRQARVAYL